MTRRRAYGIFGAVVLSLHALAGWLGWGAGSTPTGKRLQPSVREAGYRSHVFWAGGK